QGDGARRARRGQCAADEFCGAPGVADDRGSQPADRPVDGIADGDRGAERQGSKAPYQRIPRAQNRQGEAEDMSARPNISTSAGSAAAPLRAISFGNPAVNIERRDDGTIYLRPKAKLGDYPARLTDRLHHWASVEPNRVFMAERNAARGWR